MKSITKKLEPTGEVCIKFTEEELAELNIKEFDKFTFRANENGVYLDKHVPLELDLSDFNRDTLEFLIGESVEKDISINEVISSILEKVCEDFQQNNIPK